MRPCLRCTEKPLSCRACYGTVIGLHLMDSSLNCAACIPQGHRASFALWVSAASLRCLCL